MPLQWHLILIFITGLQVVNVLMCSVEGKKSAPSNDINSAPPPFVPAGGIRGAPGDEENVVLWWTPFTGIQGQSRSCPLGTCFFTENRNYFNDKSTKAVLFYGSDFNVEDLPLPRRPEEWWALLHEESPKNQPLFDHQHVLELFNLTSTFRRGSNFPLTLQHLSTIEALTSEEEFIPTQEKILLKEKENLAPVVYVQSDCDTPAERDHFVRELSKYIKVDSYGACLHNRDLPSHLHDPAENYDHLEFRAIIAKYRFALAIENAACDDYMTEKLWRPLSVGTVPIYWGSSLVGDWIPNPGSIINIREFKSPQQLAQYLHKLLLNDTLYDSHLQHKNEHLITNMNLIQSMRDRKWGINNDFERGNFIEHFECYVCDQLISRNSFQEDVPIPRRTQANLSHYGCPEPQSVLTGKVNPKSFWVEEWNKARVEAEVLHRLVSTPPGLFTSDQFFAEVIERLQDDGFFHTYRSGHGHEDL